MLDLDNDNELVAKDKRVDDLKQELENLSVRVSALENLEVRVNALESSLTKDKI